MVNAVFGLTINTPHGAKFGGVTIVTLPVFVSLIYTEPLTAVAEKLELAIVSGVELVPIEPFSESSSRVEPAPEMLAGTPRIELLETSSATPEFESVIVPPPRLRPPLGA